MPFPSLRERFDRISEAAIDSSSIIYMLKGGFFGLLAATLTLRSVPEVLAEVGWPELPVTVVSLGPEAPTLTNDERLLELARGTGIAVISEDREILAAAEEAGLEYYNALMMLALLHYRGRMDEAWFQEAYRRVVAVSHYGEGVLARFDKHLVELGLPAVRRPGD